MDDDQTPSKADEELLAELKAALAASRHLRQEKLIADAQEAFSFLSVSDEFAALVFDSLWEDKLESASRALTSIRALTFESAELSLEVELTDDGIVGQVSPPGAARVEIEWGDGTRIAAETDDFGSFTVAFGQLRGGSGPVRFHVSRDDAGTVTDWVSSAR